MRHALVAAIVAVLVLGGCAAEDAPDRDPAVPRGFEVPPGLTLTEPGSVLEVGDPGSVVLDLADGAASAVTVTVTKVRKGSMKDFRFFSLDEETRKGSTPFYVDLRVRNEGPAGLGGTSLPMLAHTDADTVYPANELVGDFAPCPRATLPKTFLADSAAALCLVYLLPRRERLESVDLQPGEPADALRWTP